MIRAQQLKEAAISYARRGLSVFPCHYIAESGSCSCNNPACNRAGKHPLTPNGFKDATTDVARICQYWQSNPLANIGIPTGARAKFIVVDIDPRNRGDESLAMYETTCGPFSATPRVNTGGGGQHIFLRHPGGVIRNKIGLLPGIDIRGDGGYIVAPPSNHASGRCYEWQPGSGLDDLALAPIPDAFASILTDNTAKTKQQAPRGENNQAADCDEEIPEGTRNGTLYVLACKLKHLHFDLESSKSALHDHNLRRCNPLLDETSMRGAKGLLIS
ncbi:MAG: bifunctional DNA primase/polymerase, partial [Bdellovibrionota bacterium]